ncbi:hypothetical protein GF373_13210, partial [bacterium]|nr:hypothetical protein [bacterium]
MRIVFCVFLVCSRNQISNNFVRGIIVLYFRVIVFAIILFSMPMLGTAESGKDRFHILLLNSYHPELSWTHNVIGGFQKEIRQCGLDVELTCEYLDSRRYPQLQSSMQNLIRQKLQNQQPDIVVVSDNDAYRFALRNRSTVFQDIPIVFCGINDFTPSLIEEDTNLTGVAEDQSILETIRLALRLHPQTERIIVIGRTRVLADRANRAAFMDRLEEIKKLTQVSFWDDCSAKKIAARLKTLDPHTLIVLNGLMEDKQGREMMYADTTRWVRRHSALPIYSFWEVYLGHGIVGGKLVSGRNQGHLAARLAIRILQGESAEHIPVVRGENANHYIFDAKELRRFKIPHSALPREAKIINRPLTFYQKNKEWIWG